MKWCRANRLRAFLAMALFSGAAHARAQETPAPAAAPQPNTASPQVSVVAVRVVTEDGRVLSDCPRGVPVEIGKPLQRSDVAAGLRALYRTGDYSDLRAVTTLVVGGIRLDFIAVENLYFNQVIIEGLQAPPSDASAAAAMQINLGDIYRRSTVDEGLERLREALRGDGLYTAALKAETVPHPQTHQMDVIVHITPGPRARIGAIQLTNGTEFRSEELLKRTKIKIGSFVTSARLQRGTDRVRKYLTKKGLLSARAVIRRGEYDAANHTIPLTLDVSEGPKIRVMVTGAKVSKGDLKRLVPIYQEGAVDTDLLEEGKRNLRERQERDGYFDATVDYKTETHDTEKRGNGSQGTEEIITYHIERGERHKLVAIAIAGNKYFPTELLKSRLQIAVAGFGVRSRFSQRLVDSDAQSMRGVYTSNGFLDATVKPEVIDDYRGKQSDRFVRFNVTEGAQTRVASLAIDGIHAFKEDELLQVIGSTQGQPYSESNVATDRDNILAKYFNEGFPEASFTSTADRVQAPEANPALDDQASAAQQAEQKARASNAPVPQAEPVRLVYHIQEGPQTRVRNVLLSGYRHTRENAIRREVRVQANAPLRQGDVVESQRRLYNLGIFNRVTISPQNPDGTDPDKDIVVLVEEAKRYTIAYGGGFEVQRLASTTNPTAGEVQAAPRGIFEITRNNLTGRADSLSLKVRGSTIEDRVLLGYLHPNLLGNENLNLQVS
ncbi:MAG TPA: POTRA domain-containing protein, partial [Candidatus Dormibacteraeota bacterium]|nr:POTRA domain-containing protein [Candidatus Dormibacteraeota bacterium]